MRRKVLVSGATVALLGVVVVLLEERMGSWGSSGLRQELLERSRQDGL